MPGVLKSGDRFGGRYLVESLIAEGGMNSIYRARDEQAGRLVAVKVLYPYYSDNAVIRKRFIEEGRIQQALGHPNVVHVQEVVEDPLAIVMEHVEGPTLDDYLAEQGQLREDEILEIVVPVMSALGLAHSKGIIHRDLKPSNILLNRQRHGFQPKVMDFGVAKVKDAGHDLTATGTTVGTLHYMSPEQIVGSKNIDGRADIYSIGVTLYKLATGEVPFNAPTEFALMMAQVEAPPLPPSKLRGDLTPELERIILKAMEKRPVDRFQSVRQFTTALLEMKRGHGESTVRDTLTETISQELLDFALRADEVAQDRTAEMNFHVIREEVIDDAAGSAEATVEMEATLKMDRHEPPTESSSGDSTVELSTSQIMQMSIDDDTNDDEMEVSSSAATDVMERRLGESQKITRPSRPVSNIEDDVAGTGKLVSESIDTESISQRVTLESGRVVVLDHDADSRDVTAPKVSEEAYQKVLGNSNLPPRPSGPKVVVGYNPADTQEKTFEKPNFRTRLSRYETSRGTESEEIASLALNEGTPDPRRPTTPSQSEIPSDELPVAGDPSGRSSVVEKIDSMAQSAIQTASDNNLPRVLIVVAVLAVLTIVACALLLVGWFVLT